nr:replication initiation protein [uncultured Butyrivibrio sp.]
MGNRSNEPLQNLSLLKSNEMISAKYKSTLLENQVMAIALTRIEVNSNEKDAQLEAKLYPGELKRLVSDDAHIYRDLKRLAKSITGHTMVIEDGKGNFQAFSVVPNAEYSEGVFTVKFNNVLREHILGLEKNYTTLELSVMTDFTQNSSFRIYELLKKDIYKSRPDINNGAVQVLYNISEFRFMIGLANGDDPVVRNEMARMGKKIDWDVLYQKLDKKDRKYEKWYDLQKCVLKKAQKELLEKSDIKFEFEGIRDGHKMGSILFTIHKNQPSAEVIERQKAMLKDEMNRQLEIPFDLEQYKPLYDEFVGHNELTKEDLDLLLKKAQYQVDVVRDAIDRADRQPYLNNYMGWIISCILKDYKEVDVVEGSAKRGAEVREMMNEYEEGKRTGEVQRIAWERIQKKEDFEDFSKMIEDNGLTMEALPTIYSPAEMVRMYTDWKVGREISF